MYLLETFITKAGLNVNNFDASILGMTVNYTDGKSRPITEEEALAETLFAKTPVSLVTLEEFLSCEENLPPDEVNIRITDLVIMINPNTPKVSVFFR